MTIYNKKILAWIIGITFPLWIFPLIVVLPVIFLGGIILLIKDTAFEILNEDKISREPRAEIDYYDED